MTVLLDKECLEKLANGEGINLGYRWDIEADEEAEKLLKEVIE